MNYWRSFVALSWVFFVVACSGGSGRSVGNAPPPVAQVPPPVTTPASVSLSASSVIVDPGDSVTLTWSSSNASECEASDGWSGIKSLSGSELISNIVGDTSFSLSCSGSNGGGIAVVTVQASSGGTDVSLTASPPQIAVNDSTTLTWDSANATSCTASGAWSGVQALSGSFVTGALTQDSTYQLTCDGPGGSSIAIITVRVLSRTIRWTAPTENVDGSPLTNLAGFVVYWGTQNRTYTGSFTINSPTSTEWDATVSPGPYYFAVTAVDADDNESEYSNEILKTIP